MKKLFTLLACFITLAAHADHARTAALHILNAERKDYTIIMDGEKYRSEKFNLQIVDIQPGPHEIVVLENNYHSAGRVQNSDKIVFRSTMYFLANMQYDYVLDLDNRLQITQVAELEMQYEDDHHGYDEQHDESQWNHHHDDVQMAPACSIMNSGDFNMMLSTLEEVTFEDTRVLQYRVAVQYAQLSVAQIAQVMNLFHFEDNKMIVAKESFALVWDRQNYYRLADAFTFSSSQEELLHFIQEHS